MNEPFECLSVDAQIVPAFSFSAPFLPPFPPHFSSFLLSPTATFLFATLVCHLFLTSTNKPWLCFRTAIRLLVVDTAMVTPMGMGMATPVVVARLKLDRGNLPRSTGKRMATAEWHQRMVMAECHHMDMVHMDTGTKPKVFVDGK